MRLIAQHRKRENSKPNSCVPRIASATIAISSMFFFSSLSSFSVQPWKWLTEKISEIQTFESKAKITSLKMTPFLLNVALSPNFLALSQISSETVWLQQDFGTTKSEFIALIVKSITPEFLRSKLLYLLPDQSLGPCAPQQDNWNRAKLF